MNWADCKKASVSSWSTTSKPAKWKAEMNKKSRPHFLGKLYIARKPCGRIVAGSWVAPGWEEENASLTARWKKHGFTVETVDRYEGDPQPQWICGSTEPCACRDAERAAK